MKKIILAIISILTYLISYWYCIDIYDPCPNCLGWDCCSSCPDSPGCLIQAEHSGNQPQHQCTTNNDCVKNWQTWICINWDNWYRECIYNEYWNLWFEINPECMLNGQCWMNIYETAGIRQWNTSPSVKTFAQDIILGMTTFFWTVISIIFIVSGLMYIFSWFSGKSPDKAKKMMVWSIIWLLFVTLSYSIIRLIQFLATWWS